MTSTANFPAQRLRRLRANRTLRALIRDTHIRVDDLVAPLFVKAGLTDAIEIASMPTQFQHTITSVVDEARALHALGIRAILLFGIPNTKDATGQAALDDHGIVQSAIKAIKAAVPEMLVIADLCLCEYTDHGHCGIFSADKQTIDNDQTLEALSLQALSLAKAGVDVIAPSCMTDGIVGALRSTLDANGFLDLPILSYAIKYASCFYGPFRDAAEGAPKFGDRTTYQMDPARAQEALSEAQQDVQEGADMLMVKPGMPYLDIIYRIKTAHPAHPLFAYQVSGEFAMIKAAAAAGAIDEIAAIMESALAFKRAGADCLITYFSKEIAQKLQS